MYSKIDTVFLVTRLFGYMLKGMMERTVFTCCYKFKNYRGDPFQIYFFFISNVNRSVSILYLQQICYICWLLSHSGQHQTNKQNKTNFFITNCIDYKLDHPN